MHSRARRGAAGGERCSIVGEIDCEGEWTVLFGGESRCDRVTSN